MTALETYLRELRDIRSTGSGVKETSYYPALSNLFNEVGKRLKPRVRCIINLANRGAGLPDGGLFTAEQFQKPSDAEPLPGQPPARGVIEVKPAKDDAWTTADGEQVSRYWGKYRQVLVTNYRDFVLVGQDAEGKPAKLESFRLAESEKAFWAAAAHPRSLAEKVGERFEEYLLRVMRHAAQLTAPEDVAWFLASYARDARARIEHVELPALATVRSALEEALGLKFEGEKGEHFFRSSLVQTLFYGVFSAWVLWTKQNPPSSKARFDWYTTARYLRVPMISKLFYLVADPQELEALKLTEVLDWATLVLNRVDRRSFFDKFQESHAVQYFYEPFLEAFDPELRKELGVWYTPPEIVKYMVERVDTVLRQELSLPLGLADKNVYVLDPCCGTGSYLVEVLDRIHRTLKERGEDALTVSDLKEAAQKRVFGFEILPAPFVVSHLQLGLLLQNLGAPLDVAPGFSPAHAALKGGATHGPERVGVYLTNALTGWEPPTGPKKQLVFKEMEEERDAAEHVKREVEILVILGNPPYNAFAGVSPAEEQGLVEPYKEGLQDWGITKNYLDDLYVRFFRLAERRIVQGPPGKGIVCFISNFSYLGDPSFVVMRKRFLSEFDKLWFDCMNGDSRETGKLTPEGKPDPSVFSTERNREGIRVGTAIALLARVEAGLRRAPTRIVRFRHFWGVAKRVDLVRSLGYDQFDAQYESGSPNKDNRFSFRPSKVSKAFKTWPTVSDLSGIPPMLGLNENRAGALQDIDRQRLEERMRMYLDPKVEWTELTALHTGLTRKAAGFDPNVVREKVLKTERYTPERVVRYLFRPFDLGWAYISDVSPLWNRSRPDLRAQIKGKSRFLLTRPAGASSPEGVPVFMTSLLGEQDSMRGHAYYFPLQVWPARTRERSEKPNQARLPGVGGLAGHSPEANVSSLAREYLRKLGIENPDADAETAGFMWMHALAISYSPAYLAENADGIRQDWPRIPLPDSKEALLASAALGKQIAALLDTETSYEAAVAALSPAPKTPVGTPALQKIATFTLPRGTHLDEAKHFAVTAGWGHAGKGGVTMPGKGKIIERDYTEQERAAVAALYERRFLTQENPTVTDRRYSLGERTCDVYLNQTAYWSNIPLRVWEYTIGGYQVIKKWLSYREEKLLGRALTKDEVRYVQEMARRIAAILLLEPALDSNYQSVKEHTFAWKG